MNTKYLAVAAALSLLACSQRSEEIVDVGDLGDAVDAGLADLSFDATQRDAEPPVDASTLCTDALDIVFVIDVSTSMGDVLGAVREGITEIWNTATGLSANARFGLVVFVDDVMAVNSCTALGSVAELQAQFDLWRDFCATNENPVSHTQNYDCPENSLDAIFVAAEECPWRSPSTHILIHITDDTFMDRPFLLSESVEVQHIYSEVASELINKEVRFAAFANAGQATCGSYLGAPGFHAPYRGQDSLPTQTGGRAWDLAEVRAGSLSMGAAISQLLTEEYCTVFLF